MAKTDATNTERLLWLSILVNAAMAIATPYPRADNLTPCADSGGERRTESRSPYRARSITLPRPARSDNYIVKATETVMIVRAIEAIIALNH